MDGPDPRIELFTGCHRVSVRIWINADGVVIVVFNVPSLCSIELNVLILYDSQFIQYYEVFQGQSLKTIQ